MPNKANSAKSHDILDVFSEQRDSLLHQKGEMIVDSARVVNRLLKTDIPVKLILCTSEYAKQNQDLLAKRPEVQVFERDAEFLKTIVGYRIHSGVMALAQRPQSADMESLGSRVVFLNGVNNSENVGAIVRNALALGINSLIFDKDSCSPFVRRSIRVSMGSIFKLKVHESLNACETLKQLKDNGYKICMAHLGEDSLPVDQIKFSEKQVFVIGNEGDGIHPQISDLGDQHACIPMSEGIDSLNAAVASGILFYEAYRQSEQN